MIAVAHLITLSLLFLLSVFSYSHLNWKEDLFLLTLIGLYLIGLLSRRLTKELRNYFLIFIFIFLLSQFYINNFQPGQIKWWFVSIPGSLTVLVAFMGFVSLVSFKQIRVDSEPIRSSDQILDGLINKAIRGIIVVSLAMFFLFVLNIDEISPQEKLVPDYSIYIIVPFGFALFYFLKFSLRCVSSRKKDNFLKSATLGILIFLVGIGAQKTYIVYSAYNKALHSSLDEKIWHDLMGLNRTSKIKSIDIKALNELGKISMEKGNLTEAANYFKRNLIEQAFNFEANLRFAEVVYKQKEWGRAYEAYNRVIYLRPKERNFYPYYVHACIKDDKLDKTLEFITNLKDTHPITLEETEDYLIIGEGLFKKGWIKEAITYLHRATELMPHNYKAYFFLGRAYLESGQYAKGCESLEKVVRLSPNFAEGYYYLGIGYENSHQDYKAIEAFKRAVLIDNKNIEGLYHLKRLYTRIGLENKAIKTENIIETIATKVIEAADWKGRSGENIYQNGEMYWTGTVSADVLLKDGNAKFIIQAMGSSAKGVWPHMVVRLDNEIIGEVHVTSEKVQKYEFKKPVKAGKYNLCISFTNDEATLDKTGKVIEDRNLFVKKCRITYD